MRLGEKGGHTVKATKPGQEFAKILCSNYKDEDVI